MSAPPTPPAAEPARRRSRLRARISAFVLLVLIALPFAAWWWVVRMPGERFSGPLPPLDARTRVLADELREHVARIASEEHNLDHPAALDAASVYVEQSFVRAGYTPRRETFDVNGHACANLEAVRTGTSRPNETIVVGAHYDSAETAPGADDNASGTAAVLALARHFANRPAARTIRFVAFTNEEPPYFKTESMGSLVYARALAARRVNVVAMLSLETIGYYSDAPDSQAYPFPLSLFYPSRGDFIAFVSDTGSRSLLHEVITSFRAHARFPSDGGAPPGSIPGVDWSDHWSFWQAGYPAVMVTDTAPFRNPHYHTPQDTPDTLDYERMARVVAGLRGVVWDLANASH